MYEQLLQKTGLNDNEALVYEFLLKNGEQKAGQIASKTPLKRGLIYKTLLKLEETGLIEKNEPKNQVAKFSANHPSKLRDLANLKEKEVSLAKESIDQLLPQLTSEFNLSAGKPGVRFYEGIEGFTKTLEDSLYSKETIYTYVDINSLNEEISAINKKYVEKRKKRGINKKILLLDTPNSRKMMQNQKEQEKEDYRFLPNNMNPFKSAIQIYDNKIVYHTLREKNVISVIIEDEDIYLTHKYLFEMIWNNLTKKENSPKKKGGFSMDNLEEYSTASKN